MTHPGELKLRRLLAEEDVGEDVAAHVRTCAECTDTLQRLMREHEAFQAEIPFERFAAGVEKAARLQQRGKPVVANLRFAMGLAAVVVALVGAQLVLQRDLPESRVKGGEAVDFVVAGANGQRNAAPVEQLARGERLRIGVSGHRYVLALSVDEQGQVSTVYSEALEGTGHTWLPDSVEFTGAGREHVVVLLSDTPLAEAPLAEQLRARFKAGGLDQLNPLEVTGVQVHRTFLKP
ncbi:MAG: hypothetical protein ACOZQL_12155 [Myxococcota bacterium]